MSDVVNAHLDALDATLMLAQAQMRALRHAMQPVPSAKPITPQLPERCAGKAAAVCGLQSEDARQDVASFANPHAWRCAGCGHNGSADAVM